MTLQKDTHILKEFSLPVQKVLVQQVVTFLLDGSNSKRALTNPAHVIWAMEVCGQGFCLPIEEEESISKVINLYRIWALESAQRPASISENLQFFLQVKKKSTLHRFLIPIFFFWNSYDFSSFDSNCAENLETLLVVICSTNKCQRFIGKTCCFV
jgi:hypothetical protein